MNEKHWYGPNVLPQILVQLNNSGAIKIRNDCLWWQRWWQNSLSMNHAYPTPKDPVKQELFAKNVLVSGNPK